MYISTHTHTTRTTPRTPKRTPPINGLTRRRACCAPIFDGIALAAAPRLHEFDSGEQNVLSSILNF